MSFNYKPFPTSDHTLTGVIGLDGKPYFLAKDVALFMQYTPGYGIKSWLKTHPRKEMRDVLEGFWLLPYQQKAVLSYPETIEFMRSKTRYYKEGADQFMTAYEQHPLDDESSASWEVTSGTLHQMRFCRSVQDKRIGGEVKTMQWWVEKFSVGVLKAYQEFEKERFKFKDADYTSPASVPLPCPAKDNYWVCTGDVYRAPASVPPRFEDSDNRHDTDFMEPTFTESVEQDSIPVPQATESPCSPNALTETVVDCREEVVETEEREESESGDKSSGEEWLPSEKLSSSSSSSFLTAEGEEQEDGMESDYAEQPQTGAQAINKLRKRKREHPTDAEQVVKLPKIYLNVGDKEYSLEITVQVEETV